MHRELAPSRLLWHGFLMAMLHLVPWGTLSLLLLGNPSEKACPPDIAWHEDSHREPHYSSFSLAEP